jgi:hypothetical protein
LLWLLPADLSLAPETFAQAQERVSVGIVRAHPSVGQHKGGT